MSCPNFVFAPFYCAHALNRIGRICHEDPESCTWCRKQRCQRLSGLDVGEYSAEISSHATLKQLALRQSRPAPPTSSAHSHSQSKLATTRATCSCNWQSSEWLEIPIRPSPISKTPSSISKKYLPFQNDITLLVPMVRLPDTRWSKGDTFLSWTKEIFLI
jgi:hypothetical protein